MASLFIPDILSVIVFNRNVFVTNKVHNLFKYIFHDVFSCGSIKVTVSLEIVHFTQENKL